MTRTLLLLSFAALAACRPAQAPAPGPADEPDTSVADPAETEPENTPINAIGDLIGEYRVAGIDGEALNADIGIALSIDGPLLSSAPSCAGFVWDIGFDGERLVTQRHRDGPPIEPGAPPPPVCAVAVSPEQRQLAEAIDAADHAARTPENAILLSGGGRSVTLFGQ